MNDLEHRFADKARQIEGSSVARFGEICNTRLKRLSGIKVYL